MTRSSAIAVAVLGLCAFDRRHPEGAVRVGVLIALALGVASFALDSVFIQSCALQYVALAIYWLSSQTGAAK